VHACHHCGCGLVWFGRLFGDDERVWNLGGNILCPFIRPSSFFSQKKKKILSAAEKKVT
jgi:hypothetical protein